MERLHTAVISPAEFGRETSPDGRYYTTYKDNIFGGRMSDEHLRQFQHGDGNELYGKACAVASSAMLAYNFFHWINKDRTLTLTLTIDGKCETFEFDEVTFERKFPCIIGSNRYANMDVVLTSSKSGVMLCIESKFTEHLENDKCKIAEAYIDSDKTSGINWKPMVEKYQEADCYWYQAGLKQNISHLVALNRFVSEGRIEAGKIKFINVIFMPSDEYMADFEYDKMYRKELKTFQRNLEEKMPNVPVKLDKILTYRDIYDAICVANAPEGLKDYLEQRYIKYHK